MQSRSTLLALAGLFAAFTLGKRSSSKITSTKAIPKDAKLVAGSKEIGYAIYDCNKLVIYDSKKAYNYVFDLGLKIDENSGYFDELLLGDCFEDDSGYGKKIVNTKEKTIFILNLFKYYISGYVANHPEDSNTKLKKLESLKENFAELTKFDLSSFKIELVKKP